MIRTVFKYVILIAAFLGSLYIILDQRKKLEATRDKVDYGKTKSYSLEELENRRSRMLKNIDDTK